MSHATKPGRLLVTERARLARVPALIIVAYAAAVYLFFLAVLGFDGLVQATALTTLHPTLAVKRLLAPA